MKYPGWRNLDSKGPFPDRVIAAFFWGSERNLVNLHLSRKSFILAILLNIKLFAAEKVAI